MMNLVTMKSDFILSANSVYSNLKEYEKDFSIQAKVISSFKCMLLRNEEIEDYVVDGIQVNVFLNNDSAVIYFDDYVLNVDIKDKQIINYDISRC